MAYSTKITDHYENPRNVGTLSETDTDVGTGLVGAPACGDVLKLQIRIKDGKIVDAKFKAYGCGSAIASSSLGTEMLMNKTLTEAEGIKNSSIAEELSLPPLKLHCSLLVQEGIQLAIQDYKNKNNITNVA